MPRRRLRAAGETPNSSRRQPKPTPSTPSPAPDAQPYARALFAQLARPSIMPTRDRSEGLRLIFDLESDGLLDAVTRVHCIVIGDLDSDRVHEYGPGRITAALAHLAHADVLIGHNIQGYDLPVLQQLHGWAPRSNCRIVDTLIAARIDPADLANIDAEVAALDEECSLRPGAREVQPRSLGPRGSACRKSAPRSMNGPSGPPKSKRAVSAMWRSDKPLWHFLQPDGYRRAALDLEHRVAAICDQITADGAPFDAAAAEQLREQWEDPPCRARSAVAQAVSRSDELQFANPDRARCSRRAAGIRRSAPRRPGSRRSTMSCSRAIPADLSRI